MSFLRSYGTIHQSFPGHFRVGLEGSSFALMLFSLIPAYLRSSALVIQYGWILITWPGYRPHLHPIILQPIMQEAAHP